MATSMSSLLSLTFLSVLYSYVLADGRFMLAHVPDYVTVHTDVGAIDAHEIPDVFSLALGFSSSKPVSWHGLTNGNLFRRPKAAVLVTIEELAGTDALEPSSLKSVPVKQVKPGSLNLDAVRDAISRTYGNGKRVAVELNAGMEFVQSPEDFPDLFRGLPPLRLDKMVPLLKGSTSVTRNLSPYALNLTHPADLSFFSELQVMQEVLLKLKENPAVVEDNVPDVFAFELSGFRALQSQYGADSAQVIDAQNVLADFIQKWGQEMIDLYGGDLFMGVATVPMEAFLHRQGRSLMQATEPTTESTSTMMTGVTTVNTEGTVTVVTKLTPTEAPSSEVTPESLNVAPYYDDSFPVFFNIFLWLGIVLALATLVIAYMLGNMDPGDSIIYRMTSQRIKMD
ncbi:renin receptor-like isoform X1 [Diadema antillarum]|uniref:renin receptor-like isoform X1 n=1 Tax=Diadema antillarum TaxID=105358 RepID=UPI003A852020